MTPFWSSHNGETQLTIYQGDVMEVLRQMDAESVHCVVTSPPYWGLRNYGLEPQAWPDGWYGPFALEPTFALYVAHFVGVFREVRRVLRSDGTVWCNMGDAYVRSKGIPPDKRDIGNEDALLSPSNLKPKDLLGMPWRVAFALQADGWWLRSDIIWSKPNPMMESATDRPTKAHEYLFLLARAERYYYNAEAILEALDEKTEKRYKYGFAGGKRSARERKGDLGSWAERYNRMVLPMGRNKRTVWTIPTEPYPEAHFATYPQKLVEPCILAGCPVGGSVLDPFLGSGTTLLVAQRLGRNGIGIELKEDYCRMAVRRLEAEHSQVRLCVT